MRQVEHSQVVRRAIASLVIALLFIGLQVARATTFQVTPGELPYPTISAAVAMANSDPGTSHTIIIPAGEYTPADGETFPIDIRTTEVTFIGAGSDKTIINAEGMGSIFVSQGPPASPCTAISISDMTLVGGVAPDGGAIYFCNVSATTIANCIFFLNRAYDDGGAIFLEADTAQNVTIAQTTIIDNYAGDSGGGIYIQRWAGEITQCDISNNLAAGTGGGGIYCEDALDGNISNSVFEDNTTTGPKKNNGFGGGMYVTRSVCTIEENWMFDNIAVAGGAIYAKVNDALYCYNNLIGIELAPGCAPLDRGNRALENGGGVYLFNNDEQTIFDANNISFNQAPVNPGAPVGSGGGAVCAIKNDGSYFINNVMTYNNSGNSLDLQGSACLIDTAQTVFLYNTFDSNTPSGAGQQTGVLHLVGNSAPVISSNNLTNHADIYGIYEEDKKSNPAEVHNNNFYNTPLVYYDFKTGVLDIAGLNALAEGSGNISGDPAYVSSGTGDYHLLPGSASIASAEAHALVPYDFDSDSRPLPSGAVAPDIGADEIDEANPPPTPTPTPTPSPSPTPTPTPTPSPTPTPTGTPTATPTATPSPTPTPTPTAPPTATPTPVIPVKQYTFDTDVEGWTFLGLNAPPYFYPASSSYTGSRLGISSASDATHRVGFWNGPAEIAYVASNVYRATFLVSSSQATASQNPQFRMRWIQDQSLESASHVVNASAPYTNSLPTDPTTKEYSCYFAPILTGNMGVAFDMLDFSTSQYGAHYVDQVTVERFPDPAVGTAVKTYTSSTDFSNWGFVTNVGYGPVTSGGAGTGTLSISSGLTNSSNFGWWQSSGTANKLTYVADKLYRASYTLRCASDAARNDMPQVRLRCQNEDGQMTQTMELNSQTAVGPGAMPTVSGTDYDVYFETPTLPGSPTSGQDGFIVVIDMLDFDAAKGGTIYMDSVAIDYVEIP